MLRIVKLVFLMAVIFVFSFTVFLFAYTSGYKEYLGSVERYSKKYGVDEALILAIIKTESGFDKNAVSKKGAKGLMQIMPETANFIAERLGRGEYDLFDGNTSIEFGVYYLSYLFERFIDDYKVICAYNAGEGRVSGWLKLGVLTSKSAPYKETQSYLNKVKLRKKLYKILLS